MTDPGSPLRPAAPAADARDGLSAGRGAAAKTEVVLARARAVREMAAAVAIALACVAWLAVGGVVLLFLAARDDTEPEGMTGFAFAVMMPLVLVPALGLTSLAAHLGRIRWRGWIAPTIAVVAAGAALLVLAGWWSLVDLLG